MQFLVARNLEESHFSLLVCLGSNIESLAKVRLVFLERISVPYFERCWIFPEIH